MDNSYIFSRNRNGKENKGSRYKICLCCKQKMMEHKESLTIGLLKGLYKFYMIVKDAKVNNVHTSLKGMDMGIRKLSHNEKCNWTKLYYHNLVGKIRDEKGFHVQGRWYLTQKGYLFLKGEIPCNKFVWSYNHGISDAPDAYSEEMVYFKDVTKTDSGSWFTTIEDLESRPHGNDGSEQSSIF